MPIQSIPIGPPTALAAGVSYALPAPAVYLTSAAALTISADNSTFVAFTSGGIASGGFVKSAGANTVTCKRA
jgi:hypothetical protein